MSIKVSPLILCVKFNNVLIKKKISVPKLKMRHCRTSNHQIKNVAYKQNLPDFLPFFLRHPPCEPKSCDLSRVQRMREVTEAFKKTKNKDTKQSQTKLIQMFFLASPFFRSWTLPILEREDWACSSHYASLPQPTLYPVQNNQTQLLLHLNPGNKRNFDAIRRRRRSRRRRREKNDLYTIDQFSCAQREDVFHCNQTRWKERLALTGLYLQLASNWNASLDKWQPECQFQLAIKMQPSRRAKR